MRGKGYGRVGTGRWKLLHGKNEEWEDMKWSPTRFSAQTASPCAAQNPALPSRGNAIRNFRSLILWLRITALGEHRIDNKRLMLVGYTSRQQCSATPCLRFM
jgi:hypothetical protein